LRSAGFGALLTLIVFDVELNVYGFVGLLMLIGIVKKNAIMMIDFALEAQRSRNQTPADAIFEASLSRFRHHDDDPRCDGWHNANSLGIRETLIKAARTLRAEGPVPNQPKATPWENNQ